MATTAFTPHIALDIREDVDPVTISGNQISQDKAYKATAEPANGEPARGAPGSKVALRIEELGSRQLKGILALNFVGGTLGLVAAVVASSTFASTNQVRAGLSSCINMHVPRGHVPCLVSGIER